MVTLLVDPHFAATALNHTIKYDALIALRLNLVTHRTFFLQFTYLFTILAQYSITFKMIIRKAVVATQSTHRTTNTLFAISLSLSL